jgi:hypothetical protein
MDQVIFRLPDYAQLIIDQLKSNDWFAHCLQVETEDDIYNPALYLYHSQIKGVGYHLIFDLNIYQYVLSAYKKIDKKQIHRDAIALMVFCKFTDILVDPTFALYEKINYQNDFSNEILEDLVLFRQLDNADMDQLAQFALGHTDLISLPSPQKIDLAQLRIELTKYHRLKKWDTLYVIVLKITCLRHFDSTPTHQKVQKFLDWCHEYFLFSLAATSFAISLFSVSSNLMKYKVTTSPQDRKKSLFNMTWDLFYVDKFFEKWVARDGEIEFIYATNDQPLKEVLYRAISLQLQPEATQFSDELQDDLIKVIAAIPDRIADDNGRKLKRDMDFKTYRDNLISELEEKLLADG